MYMFQCIHNLLQCAMPSLYSGDWSKERSGVLPNLFHPKAESSFDRRQGYLILSTTCCNCYNLPLPVIKSPATRWAFEFCLIEINRRIINTHLQTALLKKKKQSCSWLSRKWHPWVHYFDMYHHAKHGFRLSTPTIAVRLPGGSSFSKQDNVILPHQKNQNGLRNTTVSPRHWPGLQTPQNPIRSSIRGMQGNKVRQKIEWCLHLNRDLHQALSDGGHGGHTTQPNTVNSIFKEEL